MCVAVSNSIIVLVELKTKPSLTCCWWWDLKTILAAHSLHCFLQKWDFCHFFLFLLLSLDNMLTRSHKRDGGLKLPQIFSEAVSRFCRGMLLVHWPWERQQWEQTPFEASGHPLERNITIHTREKNFNHNLPLGSHPCERLVQFGLQVDRMQDHSKPDFISSFACKPLGAFYCPFRAYCKNFQC